MASPKLLFEIFRCILKQFHWTRLLFIHDQWPESEPLKKVLQGVICERITCGNTKVIQDYQFTNTQSLHLLAIDKASVRRLRITDFESCYALKLYQFNEGNPDFLASIPRIEYQGVAIMLKQYSMAIVERIERCSLNVSGILDFVPPKVKHLTLKNISSTSLTHSIRPVAHHFNLDGDRG